MHFEGTIYLEDEFMYDRSSTTECNVWFIVVW